MRIPTICLASILLALVILAATPPNVVLVVTDGQGCGDIGYTVGAFYAYVTKL